MITVTAPGKIHLLGEHTSVYGKPALLAAIDKRITVMISRSSRRVNVYHTGCGNEATHKEFEKLQKILELAIIQKYQIKRIPNYKFSIQSEIPIGGGLGSSAALSVAVSGALLSFLKLPTSNESIFEIAYEGEKFFHGNPSGGDLAAVVNGGFTYFRKEFEFLKTFSKLPFGIHKDIKQFYLIDSGKPVESTRDLVVDVVGSFVKKNNRLSQEIFDDQERLVKEMAIALKDGNENELVRTIQFGQKNLEKLGVVGNKAKRIIRSIEKSGGAAKIMGGGGIKAGAGMLLVYFPVKPKKLEFELIPVTIEEEGVLIHE